MTEAEYEYECSRAELLGLPKPTWENFSSRQGQTTNQSGGDEECEGEMTIQQVEDAGVRKEGFRRISGGLDELSSILTSTQKKINRFKTVCGSFSNILKLQADTKKEEEERGKANDSVSFEDQSDAQVPNSATQETEGRKTDSPRHHIKGNSNSEVDKLDSLINKAERAELSLSSQNKQMKRFLN